MSRDSALRTILQHLAAASDAELAKFMPHRVLGQPAAGTTVTIDEIEYVYVPATGYVRNIYRNESPAIEFEVGMIGSIFGIFMDGDTAEYSPGQVVFTHRSNRCIVKFTPLDKTTSYLSSMEIAPHSPRGDAPPDFYNTPSIQTYNTDARRTGQIVTDAGTITTYICLDDVIISTSTRRGNVTTQTAAGITTTTTQLHPDVAKVDSTYTLRVGPVVYEYNWEAHGVRVGNKIVTGALTIRDDIYKFQYEGKQRRYRAVAGAEQRLVRIKADKK